VTQLEPPRPHGPGRCRTQETNSEFKAYLELLWQVGGAQTDVAQLTAEDIDWQHRLVVYVRGKTGTVSRLQFGEGLAKLLQTLPAEGRSEEHTSELQSLRHLVCRLLLEKKYAHKLRKPAK